VSACLTDEQMQRMRHAVDIPQRALLVVPKKPIANLFYFVDFSPPTSSTSDGATAQPFALYADPMATSEASASSSSSEPTSFLFSWMGFDALKVYFQVDTKHVLRRIQHAVHPWNGNFVQEIRASSDLYGPFWIATTVIFLTFMTNEVGRALSGNITPGFSPLDFERLSLCCILIYVYVFLLPFFVWLVTRSLGGSSSSLSLLPAPTTLASSAPLSLMACICIYGYSMSYLLPMTVLAILPISLWRFICIALCFGLSGWCI
jgi:hypothetical protein